MRMIGYDLHAAQQTVAMLDNDTGEIVKNTLKHEGETVREFYASLPAPVVVGIEATGSVGWLLRLMEELRIACRVGHPTAIRKAETRHQKHDRRDAALLLQLLAEDRFPAIWMTYQQAAGRTDRRSSSSVPRLCHGSGFLRTVSARHAVRVASLSGSGSTC